MSIWLSLGCVVGSNGKLGTGVAGIAEKDDDIIIFVGQVVGDGKLHPTLAQGELRSKWVIDVQILRPSGVVTQEKKTS